MASLKPLRPSASCLDIAQDRLTEKTFISEQAKVPVAPFEAVSTVFDLKRALKRMIGVMATEFFELPNGALIVNEIAPRVHNSGHWTQDAGCIDQFEQHIRAVAGWPLGSAKPQHSVEMTNLIGTDTELWEELAAKENTFLHFYGKSEPREGRKMGHINRILN